MNSYKMPQKIFTVVWPVHILQHFFSMKISSFTTPCSFSTLIWSSTELWLHYLERYGHLKTPPLTSHVWHKKHSCFAAHQNLSSLFTHLKCIKCLDALQGTSRQNQCLAQKVQLTSSTGNSIFCIFWFYLPPSSACFSYNTSDLDDISTGM